MILVRITCILALSFVFCTRGVIQSYLLDIPGAKFAYNPSIVKEESGMYRLFYRVDGGKVQKRMGSTYYDSRIGSILLDKNFVPQGKGNFVEGLPPTAEDPRAARYNGKTVLTYSGLLDCKYYARGIFRCTVDENNCASKPQLYDVRSRIVEKNWVPFVHCDSEGKQSLNLVYHFHPYKVFCEQNEGRALVPYPLRFREGYLPQNWSEHWGEIRGGTSLELFDGKYLSFFHSMTYKKKRYTYHFGAMIHEAKPPFRIKEISRMPITFDGLYDAKRSPMADTRKDVIYPSGLVIRGKKAYLFCGENDSSIRIIVIDIPTLKLGMRKVR